MPPLPPFHPFKPFQSVSMFNFNPIKRAQSLITARHLAPWLCALLSACGGSGSSSHNNLGLGTPNPQPTTKSALQFFGTGLADIDRVKIPLSSTTTANVGATDFAIEFWIKGAVADNTATGCATGTDAWRNGNVVIDRDTHGAGDFGDFGVSLFNGRVAFGVARGAFGATICGTRNVLDGIWHHVAVTRQIGTGQLQLYVDGTLDMQLPAGTNTSGNVSYNTARTTSVPNSDPFLVLGAEKHDSGATFPSFRGVLDELRISNTLRYAGSFSRPIAPFTADGNTVALYHFDEGSGLTANDSAPGATSPGTLRVGGANNGPQWVTDTPF